MGLVLRRDRDVVAQGLVRRRITPRSEAANIIQEGQYRLLDDVGTASSKAIEVSMTKGSAGIAVLLRAGVRNPKTQPERSPAAEISIRLGKILYWLSQESV